MHHHQPPVNAPLALRVDVARQVLEVLTGGAVTRTYPCSTSKYGLGSEPGSYRTPLGRFEIAEKYGHDAPLRTHFKSREPIGFVLEDGGEEDLVLTRILWLRGLEPENANTHERYIYIHGTNQEQLIGTAASHGCIRLRNADIAELFDDVPEGTPVSIFA